MQPRQLGFLAIALLASVAPACAGLKLADAPADAAAGDAAVDPDGAPILDGEPPDAGDPPVDSACGGANNAWTSPTKDLPFCASRTVRIVSNLAPIDPTGVSIARTTAGRVGIVYNDEIDGVSGEMHLAHFVPTTPSSPAPVLLKRVKGPYDHAGFTTRIAATSPDTLHILAHDVDDVSDSGEVVVTTLTGGALPFSPPDVVATGIKRPTELGFAVDNAGSRYVTLRISTGTTTAKLAARRKVGAGAYTALPDLTTALLPGDAPGAGASSLFVDPTGQVHLLYHHNEVMQHSNPRYHTLDGDDWSYRKTVDNAIINGLSGFSPRVAVFGTKKFAVFFYRRALQTDPQADLRLVTWQSSSDTPQIEIIDEAIPAPEPALYPAYRVAMAIDKYGLVHLAIVRPSRGVDQGYLEYRRQAREAGGGLKWLVDLVDLEVLSATSSAFVDLVVDENARPHIAYRSGKDGLVRYATRYDR